MKYTILTILTNLVLANVATAGDFPYVSCPLQDCFTDWGTPTSTAMSKDGSRDTIYYFRLGDGTETSVGVPLGKKTVGWIRYEETPDEDVFPLLEINRHPAGAHWTLQPNKQPSPNRTWELDTRELDTPTRLFQATYYRDGKTLIIMDITGVQLIR
jgi:hypothetical protein